MPVDFQHSLIRLRVLDPDPGHRGMSPFDLVETDLYELRGDLREEVAAIIRGELARSADERDTDLIYHLADDWAPMWNWLWQQLDDSETAELAKHFPYEAWTVKWQYNKPSILTADEQTDEYWDALASIDNYEETTEVVTARDVLRVRQERPVDWYEILRRAVDVENTDLAVAVVLHKLDTNTTTRNLTLSPTVADLVRNAASLVVADRQRSYGPKQLEAVMESFGPGVLGDETWETWETEKQLTPLGDGGELVNASGFVTASNVDTPTVPQSRTARAAKLAAMNLDTLVKLLTAPNTGRVWDSALAEHYDHIIWRLTAAGRSGEWLWNHLSLAMLTAVAETWTLHRLDATGITAATHTWNLLKDWQGSGGALEATI